ncbi:MAG: Holliday junction branch migration DNA helicase RuvB [Mycoplasmatales bacterium]|nr:Holliday junction branch migration DNA helicase RuvB [Mycoplasmatales bacterium]
MQNLLRPNDFDNFIGQKKLKDTLEVMIQSSIQRKKQIDHLLFYGPAGLGKTSLANIVGNMLNKKIKYAQGPLLEKKADILSLFASITKGDIIFIDEIHGINKNVEELLYSAMEDGLIDIVLGPEGDQRIMRMKLPNFTLIGATTLFSKISQPLKDRFGFIGKFTRYSNHEIISILKNSSKILKTNIDIKALKKISSYSRSTPRVANNLLKRCIDFLTVKKMKTINLEIVNDAFFKMGLYKYGLTDQHIIYLKFLSESFKNNWVSINSISGIINEEKTNIELEIEPLLISNELIKKGTRGRQITEKGISYIDEWNKENKVN